MRLQKIMLNNSLHLMIFEYICAQILDLLLANVSSQLNIVGE